MRETVCVCARLPYRNNDNENVVPGLIVAWASLICLFLLSQAPDGRLHEHTNAHIVLVSVFATARFLHTYFYTKKKGGPRSCVYGLGLAAIISMALNGIIASFRASPSV